MINLIIGPFLSLVINHELSLFINEDRGRVAATAATDAHSFGHIHSLCEVPQSSNWKVAHLSFTLSQ